MSLYSPELDADAAWPNEATNRMNRMYRRQRHIYDGTRRYYLLGRDRLISGLKPAPGASVLEIGCGTGRNLGSGAHLGATVLTTDWKKDFGLPAQTVKGALLCSGLYDLDAVRLSARPAYLKISDAVEQALSPQRHVDMINCPVALAHGAGEPPQWQRQARDFANALRNAGKPVQLLIGNGYNQFEMLETLANPYGLLGRAVLGQMKLSITWMLAQHAPRAW